MTASVLDDEEQQLKVITILRNTGSYNRAAQSIGIARRSFERYRKDHPAFGEACKNAHEYFRIMQTVHFEPNLKKAALAAIVERIKNGTISDAALMKVLGL